MNLDVAVSKNCDRKNPIYYQAHFIPSIGLIEDMSEADQLIALQKGKIDAILKITKVNRDSAEHFRVTLQTSEASQEKGVRTTGYFTK